MTNPEVENARLRARVAELKKDIRNALTFKAGWHEECRRNAEAIRIMSIAELRANRAEAELEALKLANARLVVTVSNLECCIHDIDENNTMDDLIRIQEPYGSLADGDVTVATVTAARELLNQQEAKAK